MAKVRPESQRARFAERARLAGREAEWRGHIKDGLKEFGNISQATDHAIAMMSDLFDTPLSESAVLAELAKNKPDDSVVDAKREKAENSLPDSAPEAEEWEWIRNHPAMSLRRRGQKASREVELTVNDILRAPHGPAPSRSAVYQLEHFANHPQEFFKAALAKGKQKVDAKGKEPEKDVDLGLPDVRRLLEQIRSSKGSA